MICKPQRLLGGDGNDNRGAISGGGGSGGGGSGGGGGGGGGDYQFRDGGIASRVCRSGLLSIGQHEDIIIIIIIIITIIIVVVQPYLHNSSGYGKHDFRRRKVYNYNLVPSDFIMQRAAQALISLNNNKNTSL